VLSSTENFLEAIRFGSPDYVPLGCEPVFETFELQGIRPTTDRPDLWGVTWEGGGDGTFPFPKGHPLTTLDELDSYRVPSAGDPKLTGEMQDQIARVNREEKLLLGYITQLLFEKAWAIMGMEDFLTSLITHPKEAREYLHGIATYSRGIFDRYLELGSDGVGCSEDLGSQRALMMSPEMFRAFILPEYVYIFENVLAAGKIVFFHSCGQIETIAADLADLGLTILNPVQARANDLCRVKSDTHGRTALHGAIDTALLAGGTPESVRAEVIRVMEILKPGGGYVCAPDQEIPGFPAENTEALWDTAREVGRY
jgi:uroporphyrinogen decarboxylase